MEDRNAGNLGWDTLTYELRRRGEPLREWFEVRFPGKKNIFSHFRETVGNEIVVPPNPEISHTVGWAYEFLLRFTYDASPSVDEAFGGVNLEILRTARIRGVRGKKLDQLRAAWADVIGGALEVACEGGVTGGSPRVSSSEDSIRAAWVLALLAELGRGASLDKSPLRAVSSAPSLPDALDLAPLHAVKELEQLYSVTADFFEEREASRLVWAPRLDALIVADPDLFVGSTVVEIKCSGGRRKRPDMPWSYGLDSRTLFQVLAYGLLGREASGIEAIAVLNPRWRIFYELSFDDVFRMAGEGQMDADQVSADLAQFLLAGKPAA